jgi:hypothetical protein
MRDAARIIRRGAGRVKERFIDIQKSVQATSRRNELAPNVLFDPPRRCILSLD